MEHSEIATGYFSQKYHCSQAVLAAFSNECGITKEEAFKLGSCFGGGMRKGEVCGACTGGLLALGLLFGYSDSQNLGQREKSNIVTDKMMNRFKERAGSYICNELLGHDISTPQGAENARNQNLFTEFCPKMVALAAQIVDEIITEESNQQEDL